MSVIKRLEEILIDVNHNLHRIFEKSDLFLENLLWVIARLESDKNLQEYVIKVFVAIEAFLNGYFPHKKLAELLNAGIKLTRDRQNIVGAQRRSIYASNI